MVLNKGFTRDGFQAGCLREITFLVDTREFQMRGHHLPGVENRIPDILSRWDATPGAQEQLRALSPGNELHEVILSENMFEFRNPW